jgi:hypothetical protein
MCPGFLLNCDVVVYCKYDSMKSSSFLFAFDFSFLNVFLSTILRGIVDFFVERIGLSNCTSVISFSKSASSSSTSSFFKS